MYHGIINVYKEAGFTSHDVVARLRGICKQKKIGHTGTLDPDAVGVLPVCLGSATRVCDMLTDRQKEYVAVLRLGIVTDTQDISGKVLEERPVEVSDQLIESVVMSFRGDSMQVPPMYSALKVNGKKLYELARQGREVERTPRPITIYELEILERNCPDYTIRVRCSKGTYIRTLCHDIGQKLGCGGVMAGLTRTQVGEFKIGEAYTLMELQQYADEDRLSELIFPIEGVFKQLSELTVKESSYKALVNGNQLKLQEVFIGGSPLQEKAAVNGKPAGHPADGEEFRVYSHQRCFLGVYRYEAGRRLFVPVKMFFTK